MKKIILLLLCVCPLAVWAEGENNIKMVTFFPVPYMTYSNLDVQRTSANKGGNCDVGLYDSCHIDAAGSFTVDGDVDASGKKLFLEFADGLSGPTINSYRLNSGTNFTTQGTSQFTFKHTTHLGELLSGGGTTSPKVSLKTPVLGSATNPMTGITLETFQGGVSSSLPLSSCTSNISWKKLTIDGVSGVYLVCGSGTLQCNTAAPYCEVEENGACVKKTCPSGQVLDTTNCTCTTKTVKCLTPFTTTWTYYTVNDNLQCSGSWTCNPWNPTSLPA